MYETESCSRTDYNKKLVETGTLTCTQEHYKETRQLGK